jgi:hypothetical protein
METDSENDGPPPKKKPRHYTPRSSSSTFLGKYVCKVAVARLLGVGESTVGKVRSGVKCFTNNDRVPAPKHPQLGYSLQRITNVKWVSVLMFFWLLYHSACEVLPTRIAMPSDMRASHNVDSEFFAIDDRDEDGPVRFINHFMASLNSYGNDPTSMNIGPGTFKGPRRHLQHSTMTELFWEYCAYMSSHSKPPASYTVFQRVFKKVFENHVRFRAKSEHSQCETCSALKRQSAAARTRDLRDKINRQYSTHLLAQWLDRQIYWSYRSMSMNWCTHHFQLSEKCFP